MFQLPQSKSTKVIEVDKWSKHLLSKLQDFYVAEKYCDFNVHCGEEIFKIHKVIAYCTFEYIDSNTKNNNSITLPQEITPLAFKCLIKFMYTGELTISSECKDEVLKAAILLKVPFITRVVEDTILQDDVPEEDLTEDYKPVDPSRRFPVTTKQRKVVETSDGNKISVLSVEQSHLVPSPWNYKFWRKTFPAVAASTSAAFSSGFSQPARIAINEELLENIIMDPLFEPLSYSTEPLKGVKESIEELTKDSNDYVDNGKDLNNDKVYSPLYGGIFTNADYSQILPIKRSTRYVKRPYMAYMTNTTTTVVEDLETESNDDDSVVGASDDFEPQFERPQNKKRKVYGMNSPRKDKNEIETIKNKDITEESMEIVEQEKETSNDVEMNDNTPGEKRPPIEVGNNGNEDKLKKTENQNEVENLEKKKDENLVDKEKDKEVKKSENLKKDKEVKNSGKVENDNKVGNSKNYKEVGNLENSKNVKNSENLESNKNVKNSENLEKDKEGDNSEKLRKDKNAKNLEKDKEVKNSENLEKDKEGDNSENLEKDKKAKSLAKDKEVKNSENLGINNGVKNSEILENEKSQENSESLKKPEKSSKDAQVGEKKVNKNVGSEGANKSVEKQNMVTKIMKENKITINPNVRVRKVIVNGDAKIPHGQETKLVQAVLKKYPELINGKGNFLYLTVTSASSVGDTLQNLKIVASDDTGSTKPGSVLTISSETFENGTGGGAEALNKNTKKDGMTKNRVGGNVENVKGPWECFICGSNDQPLKFLSYYDYRQHLHVTHNERKDTRYCEYCGYKTLKKNLQLYHLYTRHNVEPPPSTVFPKCNLCTYIALSEKLLTKHAKVHERKTKAFLCECNTSFKDLITLNAHKAKCKKKEIEIPEEMEVVPETVEEVGEEEKGDVEKNKNTNQCNYCNETFLTMVHLNSHLRSFHRNEARKYKKLGKQKSSRDLGTITTTGEPEIPLLPPVIESNPNLNPSSELEAMNNVANSIAASININSMDLQENIPADEFNGPNSSENEYIVPEIISENYDMESSKIEEKEGEEGKIGAREIADKFTNNSKRNLRLIDSSGNRVEISPITESNESKLDTQNAPPDVVIFQVEDTPVTSRVSNAVIKRRALCREGNELLNDWSSGEEDDGEDTVQI